MRRLITFGRSLSRNTGKNWLIWRTIASSGHVDFLCYTKDLNTFLFNIKELLIAVPSIDIEDFSEIAKICKENGLIYRKVAGILDNNESGIALFYSFFKNLLN